MFLHYDPEIPLIEQLLYTCTRNVYKNVHSGTVHNRKHSSPKVIKTRRISKNWCVTQWNTIKHCNNANTIKVLVTK